MLPPGMAGGQQNTGGMNDQEMKMVKAVRPPSPGAQGGHVQSTLRSSRRKQDKRDELGLTMDLVNHRCKQAWNPVPSKP